MGKHYTTEFKQKIIVEYKSGKFGGYKRVAEKYGLSDDTVYHWVVKDGNKVIKKIYHIKELVGLKKKTLIIKKDMKY